jgi:hypothetical protein
LTVENKDGFTKKLSDSQKINETTDSVQYKFKSFFEYELDSTSNSIINIYNNIDDIDGAFKNYNIDMTNTITTKLTPYDINKNLDYYTIDIKININDMYNLLFNENKFIDFLNPNDKYYIS